MAAAWESLHPLGLGNRPKMGRVNRWQQPLGRWTPKPGKTPAQPLGNFTTRVFTADSISDPELPVSANTPQAFETLTVALRPASAAPSEPVADSPISDQSQLTSTDLLPTASEPSESSPSLPEIPLASIHLRPLGQRWLTAQPIQQLAPNSPEPIVNLREDESTSIPPVTSPSIGTDNTVQTRLDPDPNAIPEAVFEDTSEVGSLVQSDMLANQDAQDSLSEPPVQRSGTFNQLPTIDIEPTVIDANAGQYAVETDTPNANRTISENLTDSTTDLESTSQNQPAAIQPVAEDTARTITSEVNLPAAEQEPVTDTVESVTETEDIQPQLKAESISADTTTDTTSVDEDIQLRSQAPIPNFEQDSSSADESIRSVSEAPESSPDSARDRPSIQQRVATESQASPQSEVSVDALDVPTPELSDSDTAIQPSSDGEIREESAISNSVVDLNKTDQDVIDTIQERAEPVQPSSPIELPSPLSAASPESRQIEELTESATDDSASTDNLQTVSEQEVIQPQVEPTQEIVDQPVQMRSQIEPSVVDEESAIADLETHSPVDPEPSNVQARTTNPEGQPEQEIQPLSTLSVSPIEQLPIQPSPLTADPEGDITNTVADSNHPDASSPTSPTVPEVAVDNIQDGLQRQPKSFPSADFTEQSAPDVYVQDSDGLASENQEAATENTPQIQPKFPISRYAAKPLDARKPLISIQDTDETADSESDAAVNAESPASETIQAKETTPTNQDITGDTTLPPTSPLTSPQSDVSPIVLQSRREPSVTEPWQEQFNLGAPQAKQPSAWQEQFNLGDIADVQPKLEPEQASVEEPLPSIEDSLSQPNTETFSVSEELSAPTPVVPKASDTKTPGLREPGKVGDQDLEILAQMMYSLLRSRLELEQEAWCGYAANPLPWIYAVPNMPPDSNRQGARKIKQPGQTQVEIEANHLILDRKIQNLFQEVYPIIQQRLTTEQERCTYNYSSQLMR